MLAIRNFGDPKKPKRFDFAGMLVRGPQPATR
jgi:hypothetical protein